MGANGHWSLYIDAISKTDKTYSMKISCENITRTFSNILISDIWFCAGQSNMEFTMKSAEYNQEINSTNNQQIRFYNIPKAFSNKIKNNINTNWIETTPKELKSCSAIGFFYASKLNKKLNIPIGIIDCSYGGSPIEAWFPKDYFGNNPQQHPLCHKIKKTGVHSFYSFNNAMLAHTIPFGIKGFLWYQGESNILNPDTYIKKIQLFVEYLRKEWCNNKLPFYFAELAPFRYTYDEGFVKTGIVDSFYLPEFRQSQMATINMIENSEIISTIDIGDFNDIHPKNKKDVGERFANLALNKTYN